MSFAAGDVNLKQRAFIGLENVKRGPRPRVDFYEPGCIGRSDEICAVETDEAEFRSDAGDGAFDLSSQGGADMDRAGSAAISKSATPSSVRSIAC